jgi:hypothetical protein
VRDPFGESPDDMSPALGAVMPPETSYTHPQGVEFSTM